MDSWSSHDGRCWSYLKDDYRPIKNYILASRLVYNNDMNLDDFSTVIDEQRYIKPQVALDESNAFIQNLRDTQAHRNAEITQNTYNLGTAVPSNVGSLGGSGSYFNARYQTPQTNATVADLKAVAQAQALNDAMSNAVAQAKERYNKAYKAYSKRNSGGGLTSPTTANPSSPSKLPLETNSGGDSTKISGSGSDTVEENTLAGFPYGGNVYKYKKNGIQVLYDGSSPYTSPTVSPLTVGKDGTLRDINGKTYISINGNLYPVVK